MPSPNTVNIFTLVITICLILLMVKDKLFGLLAYTIISFTRPGSYYPFLAAIRFEMVVAIIVLLVILLSPESRALMRINRNSISRLLFLFVVVVNISMIQAIDLNTAFERNWEFLKIYAFWLMILGTIRTEKDMILFLWTYCFLMAWLGYEPIYNYFSGVVRERGSTMYAVSGEGRAAGHVALGIYLCQGLCFLWYLVQSCSQKKMKVAGCFLILISLCGIMVSGSRGAIVGLAILLVLLALYSEHKVVYLICCSAIFFIAMTLMGKGYISYMSTILQFGGSDLSASSRFDGLRHGLEMFARRPLLGVGPGCYPVARRMWFGWGLWSHNLYGQLIGDLGLVGMFTWGIFVYCYIKKSLSIFKNVHSNSVVYYISKAIIVSNIVCLVLAFFAHTLYGYFWYMSAGLVVVLDDLRKKKRLSYSRTKKKESSLNGT